MSSKIGVSAQTVADYVNEKSLPRADILLKISLVLNKSIEWLLTGEDKKSDNCEVKCNKKISELCKKVKKVVEALGFGPKAAWGTSKTDEKVIYLFVNPKIKHEIYCKDVIIRKRMEMSSHE